MKDYQIDGDIVAKWWSAAMGAANHQMRHIVENNDEEGIKNMLREFIDNASGEGLPPEVDLDEFKEQALEQIMEDPYTLIFGKILSGFVAEFMKMAANGDYRQIAGTELTFSLLRNEDDVVVGCEIGRKPVEDAQISEIANNGLADLEAFLNRVTPATDDN